MSCMQLFLHGLSSGVFVCAASVGGCGGEPLVSTITSYYQRNTKLSCVIHSADRPIRSENVCADSCGMCTSAWLLLAASSPATAFNLSPTGTYAQSVEFRCAAVRSGRLLLIDDDYHTIQEAVLPPPAEELLKARLLLLGTAVLWGTYPTVLTRKDLQV